MDELRERKAVHQENRKENLLKTTQIDLISAEHGEEYEIEEIMDKQGRILTGQKDKRKQEADKVIVESPKKQYLSAMHILETTQKVTNVHERAIQKDMVHTNQLTLLEMPRHDAEFLQGSVMNYCSMGMYAYGDTKDVWYRSYIHWKFTGILNLKCGNGSNGQTRNSYPGVITKFEIKEENKFEINLLPKIETAYNNVI
eukprot:2269288-Ditylum_brightwellii.AAC.1